MGEKSNLSIDEIDIDAELKKFEEAERARLGLSDRKQWNDAMVDPSFKASEREGTTLLIAGLTVAHDYLIEGALKGLGYNVQMLDCPDNNALRFGKEFGNRGQCNPTYFTVGNLVKALTEMRDKQGMTSEEVVKKFVFVTAGACGPCRFGMYVTEYRKALRDAGFDGFRVLLFQQTGGFKQATGEDTGLVMDTNFFIALTKAVLAGDVINALGYRTRPFEVEEGAANRAMTEAKDAVYAALSKQESVLVSMLKVRKAFSKVKVDRTIAKPKTSIIGEFWAMTTEGDGNYQLQKFLESEGSECDIQLVSAWLLYMFWEGRHDTEDRANLRDVDKATYGLAGKDVGSHMAMLWFGELMTRAVFQTFAKLGGLTGYRLPDMDHVAEIAHTHYNNELRGGEGHMEVGKLILNVVHNKAHMTLSVKPFGCMPSSGVSDGVQTIITELYPQSIFCAVETSGDGAVNFYSRVQMYLFKAKQRALEEMQKAYDEHGVTREQVQKFLSTGLSGKLYGNALFRAPHYVAGSSADTVHHVAPLIKGNIFGKAKALAKHAKLRIKDIAEHEGAFALKVAKQIGPYAPAIAKWSVTELPEMFPSLQQKWSELLAAAVAPSPEQVASIQKAELEQAAPELKGAVAPTSLVRKPVASNVQHAVFTPAE